MLKGFLISLVLLILTIPMLFAKFSMGKTIYLVEFFAGNYIFFIHYLVIIMSVLLIINIFVTVPKNIATFVVGVSLFIIGIFGYNNFKNPKVIKNEISVNKKSQFDKLRVVFISDLHLTITSNKKMFQEAFEKINSLNPDIVLIGGDIIDYSYKSIKDDYRDLFKSLNTKYGVYSILGNHEYYGGVSGNEDYIKSLGINVLRDNILTIEDIHIVGRDDRHNEKRKSLKEIIKDTSTNEAIIVLDHTPHSIDETLEAKGDLQLSGHTHKGQFFPYNLVVDKMYKNGYGHKKIKELDTVVTAGLGSWLIPYRIGSTSEINLIDITFNN